MEPSLLDNAPSVKTPEERIAEKDQFITQLQERVNTLEVDVRSRKSVEELAEEIFSRAAPRQPVVDPDTNRPNNGPNGSERAPTVDLQAEIRKVLEDTDRKRSIDSNIEVAKTKLKEAYGADYKQTLETAAAKLGVTPRFLDSLAGSSPDGLMNVMKSVIPADGSHLVAPPPSTVGAATPGSSVRRNIDYYRNLRRTDLNLYMSRKVQAEMHEDAVTQGKAFYS